MLVELHSHTHYSHGTKVFYDGVNAPEEMVGQAARLGIGAITITDHNTMEGFRKAKKDRLERKHGIRIFPGEEINTNQGHLLAIGIQEVIKPYMDVQETVDRIRAQGGLAISPHPFDIKGDGLKADARYCDAIEVFNAINIERLSNRLSRKFAEEHGMPVTAGSDAHSVAMIGNGLVRADIDSVDGLIQAIKDHRIEIETQYASVQVISDLALLRLKMSYDYVVNYMEQNYSWPRKSIGKRMLGLVSRSPGRIDSFFKALSYTAFASVLVYSGARHVARFRV